MINLKFFIINSFIEPLIIINGKYYIIEVEGAERKLVTLIPGDGVGPELAGAVKQVFR